MTPTGHYKRAGITLHLDNGDVAEVRTADGSGAVAEGLFYIKGATDPHRAFVSFASRLLAGEGGVFCDTDDNGFPVPCGETVDYPDAKVGQRVVRPHVNKVYRIRGTPAALLAVAEHSAVLNVEGVFVGPKAPRSGTGTSTADQADRAVQRSLRARAERETVYLRQAANAILADAYGPKSRK